MGLGVVDGGQVQHEGESRRIWAEAEGKHGACRGKDCLVCPPARLPDRPHAFLFLRLPACLPARRYGATNVQSNLTQNVWFLHNQATATFILNLFITSAPALPRHATLHLGRCAAFSLPLILHEAAGCSNSLLPPRSLLPLASSFPAVYLSLAIPPIFHANNHTVHYWLMALFPRHYGGFPAWGKRLAVNCCTILPCLGVALGVPGSSGIVLTVTGATGGWGPRWVGGLMCGVARFGAPLAAADCNTHPPWEPHPPSVHPSTRCWPGPPPRSTRSPPALPPPAARRRRVHVLLHAAGRHPLHALLWQGPVPACVGHPRPHRLGRPPRAAAQLLAAGGDVGGAAAGARRRRRRALRRRCRRRWGRRLAHRWGRST